MDTMEKIGDILAGVELTGITVTWPTSAPTYQGSERDSDVRGSTGFNLDGIQEWEPGMRLAILPTARTGWRQPMTLVFEEPRQLTVFTLIEKSVTIDYGMVNQTKQDVVARLTASVLSNTGCTSDLAGYAVYSGPKLEHFSEAAAADNQVLPALFSYLEKHGEDAENDPEALSGLGQALMRLPMDRRCLVFIVSDCINLTAEDIQSLEMAAGLHDLVVFAVSDLRERELPEGHGYRDLEDVSTGKTITVFLSEKTRQRWREDFDSRRKALREQLISLGISMEEFFTQESPEQLNEKLLPIYAGYRPGPTEEDES